MNTYRYFTTILYSLSYKYPCELKENAGVFTKREQN